MRARKLLLEAKRKERAKRRNRYADKKIKLTRREILQRIVNLVFVLH